MLQQIRMLLVEAEEAIQRLVFLKARIAAEVARQVAEAPGKASVPRSRSTFWAGPGGAQDRDRSGSAFPREDLWGAQKTETKEEGTRTSTEQEEPKDKALVLTTKRAKVMVREPTPEPIESKIKN